MNANEVGKWLESINCGEYSKTFLDNEIEGDQLLSLTHEELKTDLCVRKLGHRKKILEQIEKLKLTASKDSFGRDLVHLAILQASPLVIKDAKGQFHPVEKLDLDAERQGIIRDYLNKQIRVLFEIATADSLQALLTTWNCTALHFSGHGLGFCDSLCFEDGQGATHMIAPDVLREIIQSSHGNQTTSLQLVFVSSCHSEAAGSAFADAGIPHVVAVHSSELILDVAAKVFARHFYLALFSGYSVKASFDKGCIAVRALPEGCKACCCAHSHEPNCSWVKEGGIHAQHAIDRCCCKSEELLFPHDESRKFLLMGAGNIVQPNNRHGVTLFADVPSGILNDISSQVPVNLPAPHGQFLGRNVETYRLVNSVVHQRLSVCVGAPGIGKSSVAIAAANFVCQRRLFAGAVFYVDLDGLELSAVRYAIAQSIGLPAGESDEEVFAELGARKCLIVLDKLEVLYEENEAGCQMLLGKLLKIAVQVHLLLVSRRTIDIPSITAYTLSLTELSSKSSAKLLRMMAPTCTFDQATELASLCGCLPLALRVVGRALANPRVTFSPSALIQQLQAEDKRLASIKDMNYAGQSECIDRCIRSSFLVLDQPLQHAFLALGLFRGSFTIDAASAVIDGDSTHVTSSRLAVDLLNKCSLVEYDIRSERFRQHNLIQLFAENEMQTSIVSFELVRTWRRRFVVYYCTLMEKASSVFRTRGALTDFDLERPNIESAIKLANQLASQSILSKRSEDSLLYSNLIVCGRYILRARLDPHTRIEKLTRCWEMSRETRTLLCECGALQNCKCNGVLELVTLEAILLIELGYSYSDITDFQQAEAMYSDSLRIQENILGRIDHPQVAEVKNYLGICLSSRPGKDGTNPGLYRQAEVFLQDALLMRKRLYGTQHPDYATSLNNMANFCRKVHRRGKLYYKVEAMYRESLKIREEVVGLEHPHVAQSLNNLALLLSHKSSPKDDECYKECESLYLRALEIRRKHLGHSNCETAATLNNLGNLNRIRGDYAKAAQYFRESLKIRENFYQSANDRVAQTMVNLGNVLCFQENYDEAEIQFRKALDIRHEIIPESFEVGYTLECIGKALKGKGKDSEGQEYSLRGRELKRLSKRSPAVQKKIVLNDYIDNQVNEDRKFKLIGRVLGTRGSHLKHMERQTNAQIQFRREESTRVFIIRADSQQSLDEAESLLIEHLQQIQSSWRKQISESTRTLCLGDFITT